MISDIAPPTRNIAKLNHRYIVPMSLWLVVVIQRMMPVGPWPWLSLCVMTGIAGVLGWLA